jgi:hypothetical protein
MRHLSYRDSYGRSREDRRSKQPSGVPARLFVTGLMVLAGIVVIGSLLH